MFSACGIIPDVLYPAFKGLMQEISIQCEFVDIYDARDNKSYEVYFMILGKIIDIVTETGKL